jgi:bacterioferritin-associated ferredoxin
MNKECVTCGKSLAEEALIGSRCGRCDKVAWDVTEDLRAEAEGLA